MGSQHWDTHYVPPDLEENLAELFPDLTIEEALQHQESLYESLKISYVIQTSSSDMGQTSSRSNSLGESYLTGSGEFDLALDEALARSLQELDVEDEVDSDAASSAIAVHVQNSPGNTENATAESSVSGASQDDIDPDRMTYEELQSLGESIGSESKGLSESEISNLPTFKYKNGFFSKKVEIGESLTVVANLLRCNAKMNINSAIFSFELRQKEVCNMLRGLQKQAVSNQSSMFASVPF